MLFFAEILMYNHDMFKRIFSLTISVLLIGMYVLTLIFGLMQDPRTTNLLMASVAATILVPVTLYVYQRLYKLVRGKDEDPFKK